METYTRPGASSVSNEVTIVRKAIYHTQNSGTSLSSGPFAEWVQRLSTYTNRIARQDKDIYIRIKPILDKVRDPRVILTFGGHFKSGKSTIINAAIGRSFLPVNDLPETGAVCILRSGERDTAMVTSRSLQRPIECTTAAIQRTVSLISQTGERRKEVEQVDRLDVTLKNVAIPALASWVDCPGINDTNAMNERAMKAACLADILLWVLSSRTPLSEVEMAFVSQYVAERGPTSVVFLLNVFLAQDTQQEWERFLANKLHVYKNKVTDHAPFMGFTHQSMPKMLIASGRTICNKSGDGFGGLELRSFLHTLASAEHTHIRRARLFHAARELSMIVDELKQEMKKKRAALEAARTAQQHEKREAERKAASFKREVEDAMGTFFSDWSTAARTSGTSISNGMTASTLAYDDRYGRMLSEELKAAARHSMGILLQKITSAARRYGQSPLPDAFAFTNLLTPPTAAIIVPGPKVVGGGATGAVAGASLGTAVVPVVGTVVGALVGGLFGGIISAAIGSGKTVQEAQKNVLNATEQVIATFQGKRQEAINFVLARCVVKASASVQPDNSALRHMEVSLQSLLQLAQEATDLGQRV